MEFFINIASICSKQLGTLICLKGACAASLVKQFQLTFIGLSKVDSTVSMPCWCQCLAGACSYMFAVMKLVPKFATDKLTIIRQIKYAIQNLSANESNKVKGNYLNHQFQKFP